MVPANTMSLGPEVDFIVRIHRAKATKDDVELVGLMYALPILLVSPSEIFVTMLGSIGDWGVEMERARPHFRTDPTLSIVIAAIDSLSAALAAIEEINQTVHTLCG
jgi:hypothetical protein